MSKTRIKWRDERTCQYCFELLPKFVMYYCSEYCQDAAKRWKEREDGLAKHQYETKQDLENHNAAMDGDTIDEYPIEGGNINE